jgi:hypothetical protein
VTAPPETLEALVKDELRGPVSELVRRVVVELVHEQLKTAPQKRPLAVLRTLRSRA